MSGISAIYILDHKGRTLITRSYRGDLPSNNFNKIFFTTQIFTFILNF